MFPLIMETVGNIFENGSNTSAKYSLWYFDLLLSKIKHVFYAKTIQNKQHIFVKAIFVQFYIIK